MDDPKITPAEEKIIALMLQAYTTKEISTELKMAERTVKQHFNRLYLKFNIVGGIKRVKLAVLMYRREQANQKDS